MKRIVFTSTRPSAGKTSLILGLASSISGGIGYMKPFGDRLIYKRKRNWDYDASLMVRLLEQRDEPENISIGFNHSKLRYAHDEASIRDTVVRMAEHAGREKDLLLVEGGKTLAFGSSVHLDAVSIARYLDATLVIVAGGNGDEVFDDLMFLDRNLKLDGVQLGGVIANQLHDVDDFESTVAPKIADLGIALLGAVPFKEQLTRFSVRFLADRLFARVVAGEEGLDNVVKHIFVGAMSTEESLRNPVFNKENKFLITSGDRHDMIVAALESDTIGVLLTNNLLPPAKIISMATDKRIPILLVQQDTFQISKQIDRLEALPVANDTGPGGTMDILSRLVTKYVDFKDLV